MSSRVYSKDWYRILTVFSYAQKKVVYHLFFSRPRRTEKTTWNCCWDLLNLYFVKLLRFSGKILSLLKNFNISYRSPLSSKACTRVVVTSPAKILFVLPANRVFLLSDKDKSIICIRFQSQARLIFISKRHFLGAYIAAILAVLSAMALQSWQYLESPFSECTPARHFQCVKNFESFFQRSKIVLHDHTNFFIYDDYAQKCFQKTFRRFCTHWTSYLQNGYKKVKLLLQNARLLRQKHNPT